MGKKCFVYTLRDVDYNFSVLEFFFPIVFASVNVATKVK
jgi:hypothetical protein